MAETLVFSVQFPKPCNREFIRTNRDFVRENREFYWSTAAAAAAQAGRACGLIAAWIESGVDFRRCSRPTVSCRALAHRDPEGFGRCCQLSALKVTGRSWNRSEPDRGSSLRRIDGPHLRRLFPRSRTAEFNALSCEVIALDSLIAVGRRRSGCRRNLCANPAT